MADGLFEADLGGHILKKRVALPGQGKRGSTRTLVATKMSDRWFFLFGFNKNERSNINKDELKILQEAAKNLLEFDSRELETALKAGEIIEVHHGQD